MQRELQRRVSRVSPSVVRSCAGALAVGVMAAPITQTMERVLGPQTAISVQQTPRGCLQECLGCDAKSEYLLYGGLKEDGGEAKNNVVPKGPRERRLEALARKPIAKEEEENDE